MQITIEWARGKRRWRTVTFFNSRWRARLYRRYVLMTSGLPFRPRIVGMQIVRW